MTKEQARPDRRNIRPGDSVRRVPSAIHAELDQILVMLDLDVGRYYELDPVAKRVWNLIEAEAPVESVCDMLTKEYAVDRRTCLRDLLAFLDKMAERGLVLVRAADGRGGED